MMSILRLTLENGLLLHEIMHGLLTLPFVYYFWEKTGKYTIALIPLAIAYLLDLDHLVDYWAYYGVGFNFSDFIKMHYFEGLGRAVVPLHAFEWILLLLPFSVGKRKIIAVSAISVGLLVHLLWDSYNVGSIAFYSIIYRFLNGFRL